MKSGWPIVLILTMLLVGCVPAEPAPAQTPPGVEEPSQTSAPAQMPPGTAEPAQTAALPQSQPSQREGGPGISYEENLRINPPAVQNLAAEVTPDGILLTWEAPPAVSVPHSYSDEVLGYKIYRRSEGEKRALLAETQVLRYLDSSAQTTGVEYFYTVTALHANNIESTRPDEVSGSR